MSLTEGQQLERRAYLGGTDAAALAGVNPPRWAQPIDVYNEKHGLAPERPQSTMMSMGQLLEPVVADLFTAATGIRLRRTSRTIRSRAYPWAGGHLDRWASDGSLFEAKWSMSKDGWGPSLGVGTLEAPVIIPAPNDETYQPLVPAHYYVQVQHYLAVTGRPLAYLAALLGYGDFRWYALYRNEPFIAQLMQLEGEWWAAHGPPDGVPPEPDGSEGYSRHLRRTLAADDGHEAVATPEQQLMAGEVRRLRAEQAEVARQLGRAEQRLQLSMGTTAKLVGDGFTINWRQQRPALRVQWEELATDLLRELRAERAEAAGGLEWPATKKARAELIREYARLAGLAAYDEVGPRPFKPEFDDEEDTGAE